MSHLRALTFLIMLVFGCHAASADDGPRRVALVIGNGAYTDVAKLPNPPSDAAAIGQALRDVGFTKVTVVNDLTHQGLFSALRQFSNESSTADWSVIYYAGHGIEVDGKNYLVPVDAHLATDRDVEFEGVSMETVFAAVGGAKQLRLVILDACRDNPFLAKMARTTGTRAITRGLARVEPEGDLYVVYSAKSGQVALDGDNGRNPFVSALLKNIETPGLEINLLFRKVRSAVAKATNGQQEPDFVGALPGDELYFRAAKADEKPVSTQRLLSVEAAPQPAVAPAPPPPSPVPPTVTAKLEQPPAAPPPALPPPVDTPDTKQVAMAVQKELRRVGCDAGPPNGDWTVKSRMALLQFSAKADLTLDVDKPDAAALKQLQLQRGIVCPPEPKKASLEPEGGSPPPARRPQPHVVQRARPSVPRPSHGGGGSCFMFNGQQVCE